MSAHLLVCGVGAGLAMAGHFPGRPRLWVPHALGLVAMLLAWLPAAGPLGAPVALLVLGAVLVWQLTSPAAGARWPGVVDTAAMAALIALTVPAGTSVMSGMDHAGMHSAATGGTLPAAVAVLVSWLVLRLVTRGRAAPSPRVGARPGPGGLVGALRFCGGLVMLTGMTVMLG